MLNEGDGRVTELPEWRVLAVWGGRAATADDIADRLAATLELFRSNPLGHLGEWSDSADGRPIADVRRAVERAVQTDADGFPAPELGYGFSLATGDLTASAGAGTPRAELGVSAGLAVGGPHAPANRVVLTFTASASEGVGPDGLRALRRTLVDQWAPDVALVDTLDVARSQRFIRLEPPLGFETWFAPSILTAAPDAPGIRVADELGGTVIDLESWTADEVARVRASLLSSGSLRSLQP